MSIFTEAFNVTVRALADLNSLYVLRGEEKSSRDTFVSPNSLFMYHKLNNEVGRIFG